MSKKLGPKEVSNGRIGRPPRKRQRQLDEFGPIPEFIAHDDKTDTSKSKIEAGDCAWLGDDGKLDPSELLKEMSYEPESALSLILGAIIDAHPLADGPTRAQRIDSAEEALFGQAKRRGRDSIDDEDTLLELGRRYFKNWLNDGEHEIEVAPIIREMLDEARTIGCNREQSEEAAISRLQGKFNEDRNRILARATAELKWSLPSFHSRLLRILKDLEELGVQSDTARIIKRIDPQTGKHLYLNP
jgi:hypothetical protein